MRLYQKAGEKDHTYFMLFANPQKHIQPGHKVRSSSCPAGPSTWLWINDRNDGVVKKCLPAPPSVGTGAVGRKNGKSYHDKIRG